MQWLFSQCLDTYGYCIRQYIFLFLTFLTSLLAVFSCYSKYKKQKSLSIQLIPLSINFFTTFVMFFLLLFVQQLYFSHLIFMTIETYSYFLLAYAFIIQYMKSEKYINKKIIKSIHVGFGVVTGVMVASAGGIVILSYNEILTCNENYWIDKIKASHSLLASKIKTQQSQLHLFNQDDSYIRLKLLQTNLLLFTFTITLILHIIEIVLLIFVNSDSTLCKYNTNEIVVENGVEMGVVVIGIVFFIIMMNNVRQCQLVVSACYGAFHILLSTQQNQQSC